MRHLASWAIALFFTAAVVFVMGESPLHVFKVIFDSAFGSLENFSFTLFYATPILFTSTAVALALEAGLFNIGAEGQLYIGALFAVVWGIFANSIFHSPAIGILGGFVFAFLGGALWGAIAGYLRAYRNTHEVIATILLNFVALALVNWAVLQVFKNPETQNLETVWIAEPLRLSKLWLHTPVTFIIATLIAFFTLFAVRKMWWGFRVRATGQNAKAARLAGISVTHTTLLTMIFSGGIAGLVGFHEVYCHSHRLLDGFSAGFGFTGVAVALLSQGRPTALLFTSLLFGALYKGALDLDLETEKITRDLSGVIQALILISLAAQPALEKLRQRGERHGN